MWPAEWKSGIYHVRGIVRTVHEYDDAAQFCAGHDRPWQESLSALHLSPQAGRMIADDPDGFTATVRRFAFELATVPHAEQ